MLPHQKYNRNAKYLVSYNAATIYPSGYPHRIMTSPAEMNNRAVLRMVEDRDYASAICSLTKTLRAIKLLMSTTDEGASDEKPQSPESSCTFADFSSVSCFQEAVEYDGRNVGSIFSAPILLPTKKHPTTVTPELVHTPGCCEVLSYAVMYNLALAYHLRGMEEHGNSSLKDRCLCTSAALYEHAHQLLEANELSILHEMAIACNLGHIYRTLGSEDRARLCFEHLLSMMLYVVDCGRDGKIMGMMDGFFYNVMPLICSRHAAAAA